MGTTSLNMPCTIMCLLRMIKKQMVLIYSTVMQMHKTNSQTWMFFLGEIFFSTIRLHLDCFYGKYVQRPVTEHLFSLEQMEMSVAVARNKGITSKNVGNEKLLTSIS